MISIIDDANEIEESFETVQKFDKEIKKDINKNKNKDIIQIYPVKSNLEKEKRKKDRLREKIEEYKNEFLLNDPDLIQKLQKETNDLLKNSIKSKLL